MKLKLGPRTKKIINYIISALGAAGGALQNYSAVVLFLRGLAIGFHSLSQLVSGIIQAASIIGGACNGLVNYFINVDLLDDFLERITGGKESVKLSGWRKFRYYAGLFAFALTGVLFGMMAFVFSAATPFVILAVAAGVFVTIIMTIQELETWLQSFDETVSVLTKQADASDKENVVSDNHVIIMCIEQEYTIGFCNKEGKYEEQKINDDKILKLLQENYTEEGKIKKAAHLNEIHLFLSTLANRAQKRSLKEIFMLWWSTLTVKKACGHLIAVGNVLALSLLFTIALVDVLTVLNVAALPALIIGLGVAFTFGAFTEFYFYNFFLAKFCNKFNEQWEKMKSTRYAPLGYVCISVNAFVNAALTYSGVTLLSGALVLAGVALPPVGIIIGLAAVSALFAGIASFVLGMDFWIRKLPPKTSEPLPEKQLNSGASIEEQTPRQIPEPPFTPGLSIFNGTRQKTTTNSSMMPAPDSSLALTI